MLLCKRPVQASEVWSWTFPFSSHLGLQLDGQCSQSSLKQHQSAWEHSCSCAAGLARRWGKSRVRGGGFTWRGWELVPPFALAVIVTVFVAATFFVVTVKLTKG